MKSLPLKLTEKVVVENVDTIPTVHNERQLTTTSVTCNSRSQFLKNDANKPNGNMARSQSLAEVKSHHII